MFCELLLNGKFQHNRDNYLEYSNWVRPTLGKIEERIVAI